MTGDHERIWLQHPNEADEYQGRLWCEDKVWPDDPEDGEPTEYVRADLYVAAQDEIERLRGLLDLATAELKDANERLIRQRDAEAEIERLRDIIHQLLDNTHSHAVRRRAEAALKEKP